MELQPKAHSFEGKSRFESLPGEVFLEILTCLTPKEMLKLRLTCKTFALQISKQLSLLYLLHQNNLWDVEAKYMQRLVARGYDVSKALTLSQALLQANESLRETIEQVPLRYPVFHTHTQLAALPNPPICIFLTLKMVFTLVTPQKVLERMKEQIEWKDCKKMVKDKEFLDRLRSVKVEEITRYKLRLIDDMVARDDPNNIYVPYLLQENSPANRLLDWVFKVIALKRMQDNADPSLLAYQKETSRIETLKVEHLSLGRLLERRL